jgi:hypothetical protein
MQPPLSLRQPADRSDPDFAFRLDRWSDDDARVEATLGWMDNADIARAAFEKACTLFPKKIITLRKKARVVAKHDPRGAWG